MSSTVVIDSLSSFSCREVLSSLLVLNINVPDRVDWKACSSSQEEESAAAKTMRQNFQPFDFTE